MNDTLDFNDPDLLFHFWIYLLTGITTPQAQEILGRKFFDNSGMSRS